MRIKPLIDADVLRYHVGFGSQWIETDEVTGEKKQVIGGFDSCVGLLEIILQEVNEAVDANEPPVMYLTADPALIDSINKKRKFYGEAPLKYEPNYREKIVTTKPYKGTRKSEKPFHYLNLTHYIYENFDCKIAIGMEADDLISIDARQMQADGVYHPVICSRDKDLKITPATHFGWTCGKSLAFGPKKIDQFGYLDAPVKDKMLGGGLMFFYSQLLTGDTVDNIPGLPNYGIAKAYKLLKDCKTEEELYNITTAQYERVMGEEWRKYFKEMASLLWITQELDTNGQPVPYVLMDERNQNPSL
jgi:hypothetical protein